MTATTTTTTTRLDLDFVVMTADFVVWSKILVEVTVNRVCTTALLVVPFAYGTLFNIQNIVFTNARVHFLR